jgi:plasmid maintenance system antidote protein VapI
VGNGKSFFNTTSRFWLNLQQAYDLSKAEREGNFDKVKRRRPHPAA